MKYMIRFGLCLSLLVFCACAKEEVPKLHNFSQVTVDILSRDSSSIRALDIVEDKVYYAGSGGYYGYFNTALERDIRGGIITEGEVNPSFRAIAGTEDSFFILSIAAPGLLYKIDKKTEEVRLVYQEEGEKVFYDAMAFWNDNEGIAMGDPTGSCLSVIITRDGGEHWQKLTCEILPEVIVGEAAFAASDTNIKIIGDHTWIVSGGKASRIWYSPDKGETWTVTDTPIIQGTETQGAYTMDFYDAQQGVIYGGDYTQPEMNSNNIAVTQDGGKTWQPIASGENQGYKSCVQYVPGSGGSELVAMGFTGISYSKDGGAHWGQLATDSFLSFRFLNDTIAYASGRNILARLSFK